MCTLTEEQLTELRDALEDCAGNLEDAADTLEKVASAVWPAGTNHDVQAYRRVVKRARELLE